MSFILVLLVRVDIGWASHFPALVSPFPPDSCTFIGTSILIGGQPAQPGDEIAFYDPDGVLSGSFIVASEGIYTNVQVYGDDMTTPAIDEGARTGDGLSVRVWDASSALEYRVDNITLTPGQGGAYAQPSPVPPIWIKDGYYVLNIETLFLKVDLNRDWKLGIEDVIMAIKVAVGNEDSTVSVDIDGDGKLGLPEAVYILQLAAGLRSN